MFCRVRQMCAMTAAVAALGLGAASVAAGQGSAASAMHEARFLGGPTAFYAPSLRSAASLKQMVARRGMAEDIRAVLLESGIPETTEAVLATLAGATTAAKGGFCDDATPADGVIIDCEVRPGSTMLWMALRPKAAKGDRRPGRLETVRWVGIKPFRVFLFRVTNDYKTYTFVLPLVCSNLSLMSVKEIPGEPVNVAVDRVCDPATGNLRATVKADSRDMVRVRRVGVAINGQPAGELTAPSWSLTTTRSGDYTFDATDAKGRPYELSPRTIHVNACPVPPPPPPAPKTVVRPTCSVVLSSARAQGGYEITVDATKSTTGTSGVAPKVTVDMRDDASAAVGQTRSLDSSLVTKIVVHRSGTFRVMATVSTPQPTEVGDFRYEGAATCDASVTIERPAGPAFFVDVLGGKDRRTRPNDNAEGEFSQCSPLLGVKIGIAKRFQNDWELAGAVGVAISLVTSDQKVKESEVFVDAEVNKHLAGGVFIGTGLSLWDFTRSDTLTPAWLLHFGIPLAKGQRNTLYFMGEGRLFFDHLNSIDNNYLVWAGFRMRFGR